MKLGILKCDEVSPQFQADYGRYPEMFANLLTPADPSIKYVLYDAEHRELPLDIHEVDAYLITGSRHSVYDGSAWIADLEEFVRTLHAAEKKVLGICFGHQLIAKALGGQVIKSPKGWGVGISQNKVTQPKKWMNPAQETMNILVSHQDQVVELPPGAEVLMASDFCPYYMLQIGTHFLTIQGHPEFTKGYSKALMVSREDTVDEATFTKALASLELDEDDELMARWMVNFLYSY